MPYFLVVLAGLLLSSFALAEVPVIRDIGAVPESSIRGLPPGNVDLTKRLGELDSLAWEGVETLILNHDRKDVWFRFDVQLNEKLTAPLVLTNTDFFANRATTYIVHHQKIVKTVNFSGDSSIADREIPYTYPVVALNLQPGERYTVLIHTHSRMPRMLLTGLAIKLEREFAYEKIPSKLVSSTLLVSLLVWMFLVVMVLLVVRFRRDFVFLGVFLFTSIGTLLIWEGILYPLVGLGHTWWYEQGIVALMLTAVGAVVLYLRERLAVSHRLISLYIQASAILIFLLAIYSSFESVFNNKALGYALIIGYGNLVIPLLGLGCLAIWQSRNGSWLDRCFTVFCTVFIVVTVCRYVRTVYPNFTLGTSLQWGVSLALLSLWMLFEFFWNLVTEEMTKRQQRAMAESRIEMVNRLSHEIRTPLNAVVGLSDLLQVEKNSPSAEKYVEMIHGAGKTLLSLVNDILDFSSLGSMDQQLSKEPFRMDYLLTKAYSNFVPQMMEKKILVSGLTDPAMNPFMLGDELRIRQIFTNLIGNALKFSDEGGSLEVAIKKLAEDEKTIRVRCEVKDSGRGIPAEKLENIFEPFVQSSADDKSNMKGVGLGLAITKLLVESMRGSISVHSEQGRGSSFIFELTLEKDSDGPDMSVIFAPLQERKIALLAAGGVVHQQILNSFAYHGAKIDFYTNLDDLLFAAGNYELVLLESSLVYEGNQSDCLHKELTHCRVILLDTSKTAQPENLRSNGVKITKVPTPAFDLMCMAVELLTGVVPNKSLLAEPELVLSDNAHHKILVVDDNAMNLLVCGKLLESLGAEHQEVDSGESALEMLASGDFNLILLDCEMPGMDGFETARAIRARELKLGGRPINITALTAHTVAEIRDRCIAAGMDDVMHKPVSRGDLLALLQRLGAKGIH